KALSVRRIWNGRKKARLLFGGVVTHVVTTNTKNGTATPTTDTANQYGLSTTGAIYDYNNALKEAQINDGAPRTVDYITNSFGEVMKRDQSGGYANGGNPHE